MLSSEHIAYAVGAPLQNVETSWPLIEGALREAGIWSKNVAIAAAATVAVETGVTVHGENMTFLPIHELGSEARLNRMYDKRTDLGNTPEEDGDGARYAGRGFVQITGRANYEAVGKAVGEDLIGDPDLALEPATAAQILAWFFKHNHVDYLANSANWVGVRKRVNGGTNGLEPFMKHVQALSAYWEE